MEVRLYALLPTMRCTLASTCIVTQTLTLTLTITYLLAYHAEPDPGPNQVTRQKLSFTGSRAVLMISDDNPGADRLAEVSGTGRGKRVGWTVTATLTDRHKKDVPRQHNPSPNPDHDVIHQTPACPA